MKRYVNVALVAGVMAFATITGLQSSVRMQERPEGYWEIEKGEIVVTNSDGKVLLTKPFDLEKGGTVDVDFGADKPASGVVQWQVEMKPKDVPKIIKGDEGQAVITGHVYVEAQEGNGWPDFIKFGINDDGQTASGETLTGFGGGEGYTYVVKLGKRVEAGFSTAGLSLPKSGEDFAVRVLVRLTYKATIDYKAADTYAFLFHYKWRSGTPSGDSASTGETNEGKYIGCYKDTSDLDLNGWLERSRTNTPQHCVAVCRERGFKYAAVQYGESCLCGDSYGRYGEATNCDYKCTGDPSQICGGYSANSVYQVR